MTRKLLIDVHELAALLEEGHTQVFDCRFSLLDPGKGRSDWLAGHIPGAAYAHLDHDLAGPVTPETGRHPLPVRGAFSDFLARSGWRPGLSFVAYDAQGGAFAARLWWLMRYFGHDCVTLLDGGWPAWVAAGLPVAVGEEEPIFRPPAELNPDSSQVLDAAEVAAGLERGDVRLLDARDAERFAGRTETIDPVAGHIPGAGNHPYGGNLDGEGRFLAVEALHDAFTADLGPYGPDATVHMCGSGVTACHNLFAMEQAGLAGSRLYVGSWSEWIRDPARPVATGD